MKRNKTYSVWLSITIEHDYYELDKCPVVVQPDKTTHAFLQKNGLVYKKRSGNTWYILWTGEEPEKMIGLQFEIKPLHPSFYYITEGKSAGIQGVMGIIHESASPGVWRIIQIPVSAGSVVCHIPSRKMYWECIVFLRKVSMPGDNWRMKEKRERISFTPFETIKWKDNTSALRTRSTEKNRDKKQIFLCFTTG
ncbi:MAG: hypothetical protein LIP01_07120 [Tannerellaceae bacterium]|nr:hypothetical protein [Tannerellaceae bacterium]